MRCVDLASIHGAIIDDTWLEVWLAVYRALQWSTARAVYGNLLLNLVKAKNHLREIYWIYDIDNPSNLKIA